MSQRKSSDLLTAMKKRMSASCGAVGSAQATCRSKRGLGDVEIRDSPQPHARQLSETLSLDHI